MKVLNREKGERTWQLALLLLLYNTLDAKAVSFD